MTLPNFCSLKMFQAARVHLQAPWTCTLKMSSQSMSFIFWKEMSLRMPALLMSTSTLPQASTAVLMIFSPNSTESQLATAYPPFFLIQLTTTSAALLLLPSPLWEAPRSLTTTLAPRLPKKSAYSLPMPPPAPVITTTFPSNLIAIALNISKPNDVISVLKPSNCQKRLLKRCGRGCGTGRGR